MWSIYCESILGKNMLRTKLTMITHDGEPARNRFIPVYSANR